MIFRTCSYEVELAQALKNGHWPAACGTELRTHVDCCGSCRDLVLVTQAFQGARRASEHLTPSGSASLLWWRAQVRRKNAATERVSQPVTIAQTFALFVYVLVAAVFAASQYSHGLHWRTWWTELAPRALHFLPDLPGKVDFNFFLLISGLGVLALLSGLVVYLASEKS